MHDLKWSPSEKTLARKLFDRALTTELAELLARFKARAASATTADDMWAMQSFLADAERGIGDKYDYRYSRPIFLFARLLREGRIDEPELEGMSEEKQAYILRIAAP